MGIIILPITAGIHTDTVALCVSLGLPVPSEPEESVFACWLLLLLLWQCYVVITPWDSGQCVPQGLFTLSLANHSPQLALRHLCI